MPRYRQVSEVPRYSAYKASTAWVFRPIGIRRQAAPWPIFQIRNIS